MTDSTQSVQRKAFEACAHESGLSTQKQRNGYVYSSPLTDAAWTGWLARHRFAVEQEEKHKLEDTKFITFIKPTWPEVPYDA